MNTRHIIRAALALMAAPAAFSQEAPPPAPGEVDEIIVTARRHAENLYDVPIAVSAYTA